MHKLRLASSWRTFLPSLMKIGQLVKWFGGTDPGNTLTDSAASTSPRHDSAKGSGGKTTFILNIGTRWRWVVRFPLRPLNLLSLLDRLDWLGCAGDDSNSCPCLEPNSGPSPVKYSHPLPYYCVTNTRKYANGADWFCYLVCSSPPPHL